ncbi:VLRF1 family aeRF1-type release factor [Bacillus tianshenii]|nr:VLRF1 family aeRF1-type release factor [Bacillus tianshenii]
MDMNKEIKKLENIQQQKPNRVLSIYLNTDPSDPDQQGGEWKIHLKNGLKSFENYMKEDDDKDEKRSYRNVREKVEEFMHENEKNLKKSVVLFASGDDSVWFAQILQMPVKTEFHWEDSPHLDQLKEMQETFPRTGIVLTQQDEIKILKTELGALLDTRHLELDLDTEDWRQATGPHRADPSMGSGGKSTQRDQFKERFEANRQRWYKTLATLVDKMAKDNDWERIYIVGDKEEAKDLENNMNKQVTNVINKNLLGHEETKVIEEVMAS